MGHGIDAHGTDVTDATNLAATQHIALDGANGAQHAALSVVRTFVRAAMGGAATYVVASNDAPAIIKARADYVCDGTDDHVQINTALALGSVQLTDGRYFLGDSVVVGESGTSLKGTGLYQDRSGDGIATGGGSILLTQSGFAGTAMVKVESGSGTVPTSAQTMRDLTIRGTATTTSGTRIGTGVEGLYWRAFNGTVDNVEIVHVSGNGVLTDDYASWDLYDTRFTHMHIAYVTEAGFRIGSADGHLSAVIIHNCDGDGIYIGGSSWQITQAHCYANDLCGIYLAGGSASRTKIANCKIEHSGQHGIHADGSSGSGQDGLQVTGCGLGGNGEATHNTYSHFKATGNGALWRSSVVGCSFANPDNNSNLAKYSFEIADQTRYFVCMGNNLGGDNGGAVAAIYDGGSTSVASSKYQGNVGFTDRGAS